MSILILDDQPGLAETLALSLRLAGYPSRSFTQPADALAAIQEGDVLITDYNMPGITGLEVARQAYAKGWRGALLIMSGHVAAIGEPLEHPLLHFILPKPFPIESLIDALPKRP